MARQVMVVIHAIAEDGYPNMEELTGRVAFIWDGYVVSGWPLRVDNEDRNSPFTGRWEAADDKLSSVQEFVGVTHWIEFSDPVWDYGVAVDQPKETLVIPEPPDGSRIEWDYGTDRYAAWRDDSSSAEAGWITGDGGEVWCVYPGCVPVTWARMVADFGESLRKIVRLVPAAVDHAEASHGC